MWTKVRQILGTGITALSVTVAALLPGGARAETVDLLLALAADVSRSVDAQKFQLQREGYAAALTNPRVLEAISAGRHVFSRGPRTGSGICRRWT